MTTKPSDLIAIANPELAQKLTVKAEEDQQKSNQTEANNEPTFYQSFQKDTWKAVFVLNLMRYAMAIVLLAISLLPIINSDIKLIDNLAYPGIFRFCAIAMLISAVCFTYFTHTRKVALNPILVTQFAFDLILCGLLVYTTGSITSSFSLLFFVVVTTGSVVLSRRNAIGLASAATIILFYEHFYSVLKKNSVVEFSFDTLAGYAILMMLFGWFISLIAQRLRHAELKAYIPGNETIEDYLVREEIQALRSALETTQGNKTEAAKLLGMTFRSFRYKLTKYDIG